MLEVDGVSKIFPPATGILRAVMRTAGDEPVDALAGINVKVDPGEVVALVGPNGAGKTTLFRIIATLLEPSAGRVFVGGNDVMNAPEEVRKWIGLLLEGDRGFYQRLTGRHNLEFFGVMLGLSPADSRSRADQLMAQFGLINRDRRVFGYSAGMRARLALARALMAEPRLLLLDEPTRSLDPSASLEVMEAIRGLADAGHAILIASHRLNEVVAGCDRAVLLVDGRVHFDGPPADLITAGGMLRPFVKLVEDD
ncbi:MAG: ABC transporter ATP-binding protein [Acidimicrobiia bacterium]